VNPGDLIIFSEMFEFARAYPGNIRLPTAYELYTARIEAARLRYIAARRDQEAERVHAFRDFI
jgi:hypothetical protein